MKTESTALPTNFPQSLFLNVFTQLMGESDGRSRIDGTESRLYSLEESVFEFEEGAKKKLNSLKETVPSFLTSDSKIAKGSG